MMPLYASSAVRAASISRLVNRILLRGALVQASVIMDGDSFYGSAVVVDQLEAVEGCGHAGAVRHVGLNVWVIADDEHEGLRRVFAAEENFGIVLVHADLAVPAGDFDELALPPEGGEHRLRLG